MKVAYYIENPELRKDGSVASVIESLHAQGFDVVDVSLPDGLAGVDVLLSFGGDGTFLSAAGLAAPAGIPLLGVNLGRMGFLAEASPSDVVPILGLGRFDIVERRMIRAVVDDREFIALNEIHLNRIGPGAIGIEVSVDGQTLPTYWADGLLVATSSGSTAYNLSVGGPICYPNTDVFAISPIAPHNLGVRPLVVPASSKVVLVLKSRGVTASFGVDNRTFIVEDGTRVTVGASDRPLRCVSSGKSSFIEALSSRLFWGRDVRNSAE